MKLIYVASPYAGDTEKNVEYAKQACRAVMESGHAFFCAHLLYPAVLDDALPEERQAGIAMGLTTVTNFGRSVQISAAGCRRRSQRPRSSVSPFEEWRSPKSG